MLYDRVVSSVEDGAAVTLNPNSSLGSKLGF